MPSESVDDVERTAKLTADEIVTYAVAAIGGGHLGPLRDTITRAIVDAERRGFERGVEAAVAKVESVLKEYGNHPSNAEARVGLRAAMRDISSLRSDPTEKE